MEARPRVGLSAALIALFAVGAFYLQAYDAAQTTPPDLHAFATGEGEVIVTGHVIREGLMRDSPYGGKQESVDLESEELATPDHTSNAHVGIRLTIYSRESDEAAAEQSGSESALRVYTYGERLRLPAKLRMPRNYGNPGALDLVGYLASQGIRLTGSARAGQVEVLPGFAGSRIGLWRARARRSILAHIQTLWPGERGALMQAMLIGGRAFFGREIKTDFQRTGTYHILVVSGINVGILAFAFFWALRKLPFGETAATVLTILGSWGYAFVADLGSPIIRATIVLNIYLLTRLLFRDRAGLNALGIAALGMLLVNPRTLFEASFQLTFLSVIAVAGIAVPVLRRTIYPLQTGLRNLDSPNYDYSFPTRAAQFRSDLRLVRVATRGDRRQASRELHHGSYSLDCACRGRAGDRIGHHPVRPHPADGLVLPSRHHAVAARQRAGYSDRRSAHAHGRRCGSVVVCFGMACLDSRAHHGLLARPADRDRAPLRTLSALRPAGSDADSGHVLHCCCRVRFGAAHGAAETLRSSDRVGRSGRRRLRAGAAPTQAAASTRSAGDHRHRCGPG